MCGIVGYWSSRGLAEPSLIEAMALQLRHRGPDDSGIWLDEAGEVGLGHRRLAIVDLSPAGRQPMVSHCQRYVLVYNGEIYNHAELRAQLETEHRRCRWRGHSDTETLLEAISAWGVETTLRRVVGMFAFAVWDRQERQLTLARDRMGEKPLYYGYQGGTFLFASELKALAVHPHFERRINPVALAVYLQLGYILAPLSIYEGIHKLPPGTLLTLRESDVRQRVLPSPQPYWSLMDAQSEPPRDDREAVEQLDHLLRQSIRGQMVADVPVGAFLSGGIDSSTVVALMQAESSTPVRTFTVGFHEASYNEAPYARAVAAHLGTQHAELYLSPEEAREAIPLMPVIYDEPFADPSQLPTFLVARFARQAVTVCLSGDGGDELFAGYPRYAFTVSLVKRLQRYAQMPNWLRGATVRLLESVPVPILNRLTPARYRRQLGGGRLSSHHRRRLVRLLRMQAYTVPDVYRFLVTEGVSSCELLCSDLRVDLMKMMPTPTVSDPYCAMSGIDLQTYLPDDILVKVDRATMAVSLEARVPLLDHRIVEYAWHLPSHFKVRGGTSKWILRQVLYRYVPPALVERPKSGFGVPLHEWLRSSLREWAHDLLSEESLRRSGLLNPAPIRRRWQEHLADVHNWEFLLWSLLMFQGWYQNQANASPCERLCKPMMPV